MRFVVDAQLPPALAKYLGAQGHQSEHGFDLDMAGADDPAIWNYAITMGAAIITKDEDFAIRISVVPTGPAISVATHWKHEYAGFAQVVCPAVAKD
ncbi:MAG: DUF5615 family PIN-like protein [Betaproteobacteria bacterium]